MTTCIAKPDIPRGVYSAANRNSWSDDLRDSIFSLVKEAGAAIEDTFQVVVTTTGAGIYQYKRDANGRAYLSAVDGEIAHQKTVFVRFK